MKLFIISIITGFIGISIGGTLSHSDISVIMSGFAGFMLPYGIVLEKLHRAHSEKADSNDTL